MSNVEDAQMQLDALYGYEKYKEPFLRGFMFFSTLFLRTSSVSLRVPSLDSETGGLQSFPQTATLRN